MYRDKSRINREGLNPTPEVIIAEHDQTEISNLQTLVESRNMFNGKKIYEAQNHVEKISSPWSSRCQRDQYCHIHY